MPRTIQCIHCGVVLNLPENSEGRRLKCPKCGEKFQVGAPTPGSHPTASPLKGGNTVGPSPDSTLLLMAGGRPASGDLPVMPTSGGGDLRETFDLPMMSGSAAAAPGAHGTAAPEGGQPADALALFQDSPAPRRKKTGAEARATVRRCPTCGGVVPVGMSLCQSCGLDLDTGAVVGLGDDFAPPPPPPLEGLPIPMLVVGSLCAAAGVALTGYAYYLWQNGTPGAIFFLPVALFAVYAAAQFLRRRTVKLLLVALTLGAMLDLTFMIGFPIYQAFAETAPIERTVSGDDDPEKENIQIKPLAERLDADTIFKGLALLFLYAAVSIYLISPPVHRQMHARR